MKKITSQWRGWLGIPSHPSIVNVIIITANKLTKIGNFKVQLVGFVEENLKSNWNQKLTG